MRLGCGSLASALGKRFTKQKVPNSNGVTVETYRKCERYITVTGNFLEGTPETLANIDPLADAVVVELDAAKGSSKKDDKKADAELNIEDIAADDPD